jgi:hypothetical protein
MSIPILYDPITRAKYILACIKHERKASMTYIGETDCGKKIYRDRHFNYRECNGRFVQCELTIAWKNQKLYYTKYGWVLREEQQ